MYQAYDDLRNFSLSFDFGWEGIQQNDNGEFDILDVSFHRTHLID